MPRVEIKRFKQVTSGEWVQPRMRNYFIKCCDCGLIHRMNFKVVVDREGFVRVRFQAFRAKKAFK